jgi:hypothetical protein
MSRCATSVGSLETKTGRGPKPRQQVHCQYEHAYRNARIDADLGVSKLSQTRPKWLRQAVYVNYEILLKPEGVYTVTFPVHRTCKDSSMFEVVIAITALSSATIFLAHLAEAYLS